jgi:hypothetical protein
MTDERRTDASEPTELTVTVTYIIEGVDPSDNPEVVVNASGLLDMPLPYGARFVMFDYAAPQPEPMSWEERKSRTQWTYDDETPPDGEVERRDRDMDRQDIIAQERMIRALNGEVEHLRKYAQHLPDCGWRAATCGCLERTCPFKEKPCTCGLVAALSGSIGSGKPDPVGAATPHLTTRREERPTDG